MTKKTKKKIVKSKRKVKKRKLRPIIKIIILILILSIITIFLYQIYKQHTIKENFNKYMVTTTNINIYKKQKFKYIKVGKIYKNNVIYLKSAHKTYYKTNNNYYVKYINLKSTKKPKKDKYNNIVFNKNIIIKKDSIIYKGNKKYFKINKKIELILLEKGTKYYKGLYNDEIIKVRRKDIIKELDHNNTNIKAIDSIPVIYINKNTNILKDIVDYLKKENYITITYSDYILWKKEYKNFPEKTILIIIQDDNEISTILNQNNIIYTLDKNIKDTFVENDSFSTRDKQYWYTINESTELTRFKDILNNIKLDEFEYATNIPVLNYHFFYDETKEACNEIICLKKSVFEKQMEYLQENNYKTLTMEEYYRWFIGEIQLPKKSVLLTVDDGAMGTNTVLPDVLEKYNQKATLFLITSFWQLSKYRIGNLEIQSHSHSLHDNNYCKDNTCGYKTIVLSKEEILEDIKKSKNIIGNPIAYCYPFYKYDNKTIEAVKEEFKLAFAGGNKTSTRNNDIYLIPRYVILDNISLDQFIQMIE